MKLQPRYLGSQSLPSIDENKQHEDDVAAAQAEAGLWQDVKDGERILAIRESELDGRLNELSEALEGSGFNVERYGDQAASMVAGGSVLVAIAVPGAGTIAVAVLSLVAADLQWVGAEKNDREAIQHAVDDAKADIQRAINEVTIAKLQLDNQVRVAEDKTLELDHRFMQETELGESIRAERAAADSNGDNEGDWTPGPVLIDQSPPTPEAEELSPGPYHDDEVADTTGDGVPDMTLAPPPPPPHEDSPEDHQNPDAGVEVPAGVPADEEPETAGLDANPIEAADTHTDHPPDTDEPGAEHPADTDEPAVPSDEVHPPDADEPAVPSDEDHPPDADEPNQADVTEPAGAYVGDQLTVQDTDSYDDSFDD